MPIDIIVPRLGWSMEEGAFVAWLKQDGEFVESGDRLFSIEGDKAIQEIESIDSGVLRILPDGPKAGDPIRVGDVLGHLLSEHEATKAAPERRTSQSRTPEPAEPKKQEQKLKPSAIPKTVSPASRHIPTISPRALRAAAELGVDWTAVRGSGKTGRIREQDIIEAAKDKEAGAATSSKPSPLSGRGSGRESVLVTGGCGFIGTWVIRELLQKDLRVVVLDVSARPPRWDRVIGKRSHEITLVQGNLFDCDLLSRTFAEDQVTHVIHLAALLTPACQTDPWEGCRVNVLGTVALLERIRLSAGRIKGFSYASSVAVFGDEPDHASSAMDGENRPVTFYGAFKKTTELIADQYWRHFKIASVGIRPQVVYGPERDVGLTAGPSLAARAAAQGETFSISYTGRVGYDYVEDVAHAFVRGALETPPGTHLVDLPGEVVDIDKVLSAILATVPEASSRLSAQGPIIPTHAPPHPRFISTLYPDWKTTSLSEGMRRTIGFYRA